MSRERNPAILPNPELPLFAEQRFVQFEQRKCAVEAPLQGHEAERTRVDGKGVVASPETRSFSEAHARRNDPATSKAAAKSVVNLGRTRDSILTLLANHSKGLTDQQIWEEYWSQGGPNLASTSPSGLRCRRSELVSLGFVEACGTGKTACGRACTIWRIR